MDVQEPFRYTAPAINLLFRQLIYIVGDLLVRNQHDMHLQRPTTVALLRKILQHLRITDRCFGDIRFQEFAKLIIYNINTCKSIVLDFLVDIII